MNEAVVKSRISAQLDASKQFLVVVIGLAMANGIAEKLKYGLEGGIYVSRLGSLPRDENSPQYTIFGTDANNSLNFEELFVLGVFLLYALRFFFNNYTLLYQTYSNERLASLHGRSLTATASSSVVDLLLSIFTGIIVCLVSMTLTPKRYQFLLAFLLTHYFVDLFALGFNIYRLDRRANDETSRKIFWKVLSWLANNFLFIVVFVVLLTMHYTSGGMVTLDGTETRIVVLVAWLLNCVIALLITYIFRETTQADSVS